MSDNFQTDLSGEFAPLKPSATVMLRGRGKQFDELKGMLDSINRPDMKKIIIERKRK